MTTDYSCGYQVVPEEDPQIWYLCPEDHQISLRLRQRKWEYPFVGCNHEGDEVSSHCIPHLK